MANKFVTVLSLLLAVSSTYAAGLAGIAGLRGGVPSSSTAHPYYVSIEDAAGIPICGGALIGNDLVLSSSDCFSLYGNTKLFVRLGNSAAVQIAKHIYDAGVGLYVENDIGLARLAKPITQSSTVGVINVASSKTASGTDGVVVALDLKDRLAEAPVSVISTADCTSGKYSYKSGRVSDNEFCALSKSGRACNMLSGSPVVANNQLVGITSWGYGCAIKGNPAVYLDVAAMSSWIESASKKV